MEVKTVYFAHHGFKNTDETLRVARQRAEALGIKTLVVASTTGDTAVKAVERFKGFKVICVSEVTGFLKLDIQEFTEENREIVESMGGIVFTSTDAFGGLSEAMRSKFKTYVIGDIVASTLRTLGNGFKTACEISVMAADGGLVRTDEEIIAIAGTHKGADTAVVVKPANTHRFFDLKIKEILCKPRF